MAGDRMMDRWLISGGAAAGAAQNGAVSASAAAGNAIAGLDTFGSDTDADDGDGGEGDGQDDDKDEDEGSADDSEDDTWIGLQLREWPHGRFHDCVCWDKTLADMDFEDFYVLFRDRSDMDKEQMREYHGRLWEHRGVRLRWFEPSYLTGYKARQRSLYGWRVNYDRCTAKELKQFVRERALSDPYPGGITLKYFYLRILEKNDRVEHTFPFLDLPPEIRIMVYEELLTLRTAIQGERACSPAILATCRQVFKEANDILYHGNTIVAKVQASEQGGGMYQKSVTVHNDCRPFHCGHPRFARLPSGIDDYPAFLRRIPFVEVRLTYIALNPKAPVTGQMLAFNHFLYSLASFLMEGHALEHLRIKINLGPGNADDFSYSTVLYPLRRLRNVSKVTVEGSVPARIRNKLDYDLRSSEPVFNTLRHWKLLTDESTLQMQVLRGLGITPCECGECVPPREYQELEDAIESVYEVCQEGCTNSRREENFIARLSLLQSALRDRGPTTRLKEMVQKREDAREATAAHGRATDAGRLAEAEQIWEGRITDLDMMDYMGEMSDIDELEIDEWSDDEDDEAAVAEKAVLHNPNDQQLLNMSDIAGIFEEWAPDTAMEEQDATPTSQVTGSRPISAASSQFTVPDEDF